MTTKPRLARYRLRRNAPLIPEAAPGAAPEIDTDDRGTVALRPLEQRMAQPEPAPDAPQPADAAPDARIDPAAAPEDGDTPVPLRLTGPAAADRCDAATEPPAEIDGPVLVEAEREIDRIRREGLTGRQLRMARRVAQRNGLSVTSDYDAVLQLRQRGIDPFQRSNILELVVPDSRSNGSSDSLPRIGAGAPQGRVQLPQTRPEPAQTLPSTEFADPAARRNAEIAAMQKQMAQRRRRRLSMLLARLAVFVLLPTIAAGYYFYILATPMFATKSEFVIQQAESQGAAGLGGLFQGTSMATQQDSITVQSFLTSRSAMLRLDEEHGFKQHFSAPGIDPLQRLAEDASNEDAYALYQNHVRISYDPTEGIVRMEVIAADPATSQDYSEALLGYAEEQVDQLTQRLRADQMAGARDSYDLAEQRRAKALADWLQIQQEVKQIDPIGETAARTQQISALESQRQQLQLELQTRLDVRRPNEAQVNSLRGQIAGIETLISDMRSQMTEASEAGISLAARNTELRLAEENYTFQTLLVQQALQQMEAAQIEANRQVRYLSLGVEPVAPDEATYPRAFENTLLAFLIFAGIYLMMSLTVSILREQVAN